MPRQLRVRRRTDRFFQGHQLLQEKRWWGWTTIDREEVPSCVAIGLATVGDPGPWVSKFAALGSWGRDGILTPAPAAILPPRAALH